MRVEFAVLALLSIFFHNCICKDFASDSKFFLMTRLKEINPNLQWDDTEYLARLSSRFATCDNRNLKGIHPVEELYNGLSSIVALVDHTKGEMTDYLSIQMYIRNLVYDWTKTGYYNKQISAAQYVGCSSQPGCDGVLVAACLFTPGPSYDSGIKEKEIPRAFTKEQISMAEDLSNKKWDKSHFLENVSATETSCAMLQSDASKWDFRKAVRLARDWNVAVEGKAGTTMNRGDTDSALRDIIRGFGREPTWFDSFGCSVITDCQQGGRLYAVVVCLYSR